ncbi:hypothetical protein HFO49_24380 [Rhizobium leguminosarum]|nr:hypothetical protein [Rhizobium leguminosarum]MBY5590590.1 hypothetical protein [Rhizobium leguminosarum]MBY5604357.1 hypothetical protein [Rhizobium leguminosarum]
MSPVQNVTYLSGRAFDLKGVRILLLSFDFSAKQTIEIGCLLDHLR